MEKTIDDVQKIRILVRDRMIERGGGLLPESLHDAAGEIGCSHVSLRAFLRGDQGLSVEMAIRIAHFLGRDPGPRTAEIVRMAGHGDVAGMLEHDGGRRRRAHSLAD